MQQRSPAPGGQRIAQRHPAGRACSASSIEKPHESKPITGEARLARCHARRSWQPAPGPILGSAVPRSTRRQSPCPNRLWARQLHRGAGWSGSDVEARPHSAPAMSLPSSFGPSRMQPVGVSGGMRPMASRNRGVNSAAGRHASASARLAGPGPQFDPKLLTLSWLSWFNHHRLLEPVGHFPPTDVNAHYHPRFVESTMPV